MIYHVLLVLSISRAYIILLALKDGKMNGKKSEGLERGIDHET